MLQFILGMLPQLIEAANTSIGPKSAAFKGSGRVSWSKDTITPKMFAASKTADGFLRQTTEFHSLRAQTNAKKQAPWTDRTGNARSGLSSEAGVEYTATGAMYQIDIFHRMPYGIWLEVKHSGRYSIINKTVTQEAPAFFKTANQVMASMFGGRF
jgi:hypothetical protein